MVLPAGQRSAVLDRGAIVSVLDGDGTVLYVSAGVRDVLGFAPEELVGQRVCRLMHRDDAWALRDVLRTGRAEGSSFNHRLRRRGNAFPWFATRIRTLPGDRAGRLLCLSRDITAEVHAEQAVVDVRDAWWDVFDELREGVVVIDAAGEVIAANRAAGAFLKVDHRGLRGALAPDLVTVIDENGHPIPPARLPSARAFRTGTVHEESLAYRRRDGSVVWLRARAIPLRRLGETTPSSVAIVLEDAFGPRVGRQVEERQHGRVADVARAVLTPRELQVLRLLAEGIDVRGIAAQLGISVHTVRGHVKQLMYKLDARTQLQAVVIASRAGLLDPSA